MRVVRLIVGERNDQRRLPRAEPLVERPGATLVDHDRGAREQECMRGELQHAINSVQNDEETGENYTIVEIKLANPDREIHIEFSRIISTLNNEYLGWVAIMRDNSRFKHMFSGQMKLLDVMSEQIRVPHAELRGLVIVGALLSITPLVVAFLFLQRFWRSGIGAGAVK